MLKFLLDANLSPETAAFLRRDFSFDCISLIETNNAGLTDANVIALAKQENRIIITQDLDFGELYHQMEDPSSFGVLILRLRDQRVESVNQVLSQFFIDPFGKNIFIRDPRALIVLDETTIRVS